MTLVTLAPNRWLDMPPWRGQRVEHFTWNWVNGVTGEVKGKVFPSSSDPPTLSHDTSSSVKRQLSINLDSIDTSLIDVITDRILPYVKIGTDPAWPLGRYMFTNETDSLSTGGDRGSFTLLDEGFAIDQQLDQAFSSTDPVNQAIIDLVSQVSFIKMDIEPTPFRAVGSFSPGSTRGQALTNYTTQGDYFPYWMGNDSFFHMIRTRDPASTIPDFDYDTNNLIVLDSIARSSDVLNAPNRFVVIGNSSGAAKQELVGRYDVPPSAPHSIVSRGFVIPNVVNAQVNTQEQVTAMARNLGIRQTIFERISFDTAIDPRRDSYNVTRFRGENWLELAWSMTCVAGGKVRVTMRKSYG